MNSLSKLETKSANADQFEVAVSWAVTENGIQKLMICKHSMAQINQGS